MKKGTYIANQGMHDEIRTMAEMHHIKNEHDVNTPLILSGPPSSGKSLAVHCFATEYPLAVRAVLSPKDLLFEFLKNILENNDLH